MLFYIELLYSVFNVITSEVTVQKIKSNPFTFST